LAIVSLSKTIKSNRYIQFVGSNTLIYFALHGKVYAVLEKVLAKVGGDYYVMCLDNPLYASVMALIITFTISIILIIPTSIINKYLPWMVGRRKNHR